MNGLMYLFQVNLYLLFFYLFYAVLLRKETFFKLNRLYLMGSALLAIAIPLVKTDWLRGLFITEQIYQTTQTLNKAILSETLINSPSSPELQPSFAPMAGLQVGEIVWIIYWSITLLLLLNFIRKLYIANQAFKSSSKNQAFSFFNKILIDEDLRGKETIRHHEMVHVRQWHSLDIIFFELLAAFNWFNPVAFAYRKSIKNIHEFIADDSAASTLEDRSAYALLLVSNVFNTQSEKLTNSFFNQSLLKRRIIMLHKTKSRKVAILKYGLSAPLFAGMLIFSSATAVGRQAIAQIKDTIQPYTDTQFKSAPEVATPKPNKASRPKLVEVDTIKEEQPAATPKNLLDYVTNLSANVSLKKIGKEGNIYVSFKVGNDKRASNFKIMKSIGSDWEKELITGLEAFTDTVDIPKGKYHFIVGFAFGGNDDLLEITKNEPAPLFKKWKVVGPAVGTATELENGTEVHNTYVSFISLPNPIIIVDGKEVTYTHSQMGLKLSQSIHPRVSASQITLKGDKAVAQYGESAREGIVVIETKVKDY